MVDCKLGQSALHICKVLRHGEWCPEVENELEKLNIDLNPYIVNQVLKVQDNVDLAFSFFAWATTRKGYKHD